jgi:hypothetical protein
MISCTLNHLTSSTTRAEFLLGGERLVESADVQQGIVLRALGVEPCPLSG